jgi:hypothetical protein
VKLENGEYMSDSMGHTNKQAEKQEVLEKEATEKAKIEREENKRMLEEARGYKKSGL